MNYSKELIDSLGGKMQNKSVKLFPMLITILILSLFAFGCGKQGSRFENIAPTIDITSYEGYNPDNPYTDSTEVTLFQQRIFWHASDPDGVIAGYAYRIINDEGNPISTAGNAFIDSLGDYTPDVVLNAFGAGWVLHYKVGADQTIPLSDADAQKTIWSSKKYATINFLAATLTGDSLTTISRFEVICIDNRGLICDRMAYRVFKSYSMVPTCFLSTTKGNPGGQQVGTGLKLSFSLEDNDPFIQATAWYYKFKVQKWTAITVNENLVPGEFVSEMPANDWINTINQTRINQYQLTKYTYPSLSSDFNESGDQVTFTRVVARVVDLAGIESEADTIYFAVKEGFHPRTMIYYQRVYALGANHSIDYTDTSTPEVLPTTILNDKQLFATPFFRDPEGYYTAVSSSNLKCWIRWGWHGEYGVQLASGGVQVTDNPYDKKVDMLLDDDTNANYFSEITSFDIRLNDEPYNYPPLANSIHTDAGTGKRWLRVPVNSSLGQTIVLTNLQVNTEAMPYHLFEVRAVDLQDEVGSVAEFKFKIVAPVERSQKAGVLVIDDEPNNVNFAPQDSVDAKYANMLSDFNGEVVFRRRTGIESTIDTDVRFRKFALSDIQRFKLIIYHADWPTQTSNFPIDHDAFALYLNQGGNMLISAGGNLHSAVQAVQIASQQTFETFFGVTYRLDATSSTTGNMLQKTWFVKAKKQLSNFQDMDLAFDLYPTNPVSTPFYSDGQLICPDPNESYLNLINSRKGLGPITYFNYYVSDYGSDVTPIYKYGSKPVYPQPANTPAASNYYCPQTEDDYNSVNDKVIGLRRIIPNASTCYIFGIPLSYMTRSSSKQMMNDILAELGM
jgi:hypothetical protein